MTAAWNSFVSDCRDRYGIATPEIAASHGVAERTFYRRTTLEGWTAPYPGVRVAPWVRPSPLTDLSALLHAAGPHAAAAGATAAWLHGLREAPRRQRIIVPHGHRVPTGVRAEVRRSRWFRDDDRIAARRLPTLAPPAMVISAAELPPLELRALVIDALHAGLVDLPTLADRLGNVGPVRGRRTLAHMLFELADREVESIFHDLVLDEITLRGYGPKRGPMDVATPDGRGARPDVPLPQWLIVIEVQGDRFHRTRAQRAADRRKMSQYAGAGRLVLQLDWWEWVGHRKHFFTALDAAILTQVERGIAPTASLPPHLAGHPRAQNLLPGTETAGSDRNSTR